MHIPRPTDVDKERFKSLIPDDARVEVKPMFGNLGAFVNGNMFMGLFGSELGDADRSQVADAGGGPFGPTERPMGGYITLPAVITVAEARRWVARSLEYVGVLPPKKPKPAKKT